MWVLSRSCSQLIINENWEEEDGRQLSRGAATAQVKQDALIVELSSQVEASKAALRLANSAIRR